MVCARLVFFFTGSGDPVGFPPALKRSGLRPFSVFFTGSGDPVGFPPALKRSGLRPFSVFFTGSEDPVGFPLTQVVCAHLVFFFTGSCRVPPAVVCARLMFFLQVPETLYGFTTRHKDMVCTR